MDANPYESPREPERQNPNDPQEPVPYPHWLIFVDIAVAIVVLAVIAALLMPA